MVTLRLAIDARAMRQGAEDAKRAIDEVKRGAQDGARAVNEFGNAIGSNGGSGNGAAARTENLKQQLSAAAGALAGFGALRQIGQQFADTGDAMTRLSNATLAGAHVLLDFSRVGDIIRQARLDASLSGASGALNVFSAAWRASPMLVISTVLSAASAAMSLFAGKTKEASDAQRDLADSQRLVADQARTATLDMQERLVRGNIGAPAIEDPQRRVDDLVRFAAQIRNSQSQQYNVDELIRAVGLDPLGVGGVEQFLAEQGKPHSISNFYNKDQALTIVEARARFFQDQVPPQQYGPERPDQSYLDRFDTQRQQEFMQQQQELQQQAMEKWREKFEELRSLGQDVGTAIGNSLFQAFTSPRAALAGLIQQFQAIAQQLAVRGISNAIGNAFGSTIEQQRPEGFIGPMPAR